MKCVKISLLLIVSMIYTTTSALWYNFQHDRPFTGLVYMPYQLYGPTMNTSNRRRYYCKKPHNYSKRCEMATPSYHAPEVMCHYVTINNTTDKTLTLHFYNSQQASVKITKTVPAATFTTLGIRDLCWFGSKQPTKKKNNLPEYIVDVEDCMEHDSADTLEICAPNMQKTIVAIAKHQEQFTVSARNNVLYTSTN